VGSVPAIQRKTCPDDKFLQCVTCSVPLDYQHPDRGTVELAVNRLPASGPDRTGSLFLNPGGPGGSGVDVVAGMTGIPQTKELRRHFDLVGFDPRGTNRSTPSIECEPDARSVHRFE
jgi:pimeloyl-ACP methyl ester carboxylesterase